MANADPSHRTSSRWPQVTLREIMLLMMFFSVLYGIDVMAGDRESLLANVAATPILLAVFLLWRITQHCRGVDHVLARVFVHTILGLAVGAMSGVILSMVFWSPSVSEVAFVLPLAACIGAIGWNVVGFVLGRYRRIRSSDSEEEQ